MNNDTLFPVEESLSPFAKWKKDKKIYTHKMIADADEELDGVEPWSAWFGCVNPLDFGTSDTDRTFDHLRYQSHGFGYGASEEAAIVNLQSKWVEVLGHWEVSE